MSLYVGSTAYDYGLKTSGLINHNSAYTWMAWVDLAFDSNSYGHIWAALSDATDTYENADWIGTDADGTGIRWGAYVGGSGNEAVNSSLTVGTPVHLALVRESSTSLIAYLNGSQIGSAVATNIAGRASTQREQLGMLYNFYCPSRLTAIKCWQAALTAEEIAAEMRSIRPVRFADLHSWHPAIASVLADALKDFSGNGRHWVATGSPSVQTQTPPVSWGSPVVRIGWPVVTAQYARPTSDVSAGTWTASSGSDLFAMLDETTANDTDYIVTTGTSTCEVALGTMSDPAISSGHIVRYRLSATSGGITVRLRQGTTTIATWTHASAPTSLTTYEQTLTGGEADSITDYSALRLQFEAT